MEGLGDETKRSGWYWKMPDQVRGRTRTGYTEPPCDNGGECRQNDMTHSGPLQRLAVRLYRMRSDSKRATLRDRMLAGRLRAAVNRDLTHAQLSGIHFYTYEGVVTIYGSVRHELDRDLLVTFVRQVPGVRNVVEHLRIGA